MTEYRDCEYGNYRDMNNETYWGDDFCPKRPAREAARAKFDEALREVLEEIAIDNGFSSEEYEQWDTYDWDYFRDALDI